MTSHTINFLAAEEELVHHRETLIKTIPSNPNYSDVIASGLYTRWLKEFHDWHSVSPLRNAGQLGWYSVWNSPLHQWMKGNLLGSIDRIYAHSINEFADLWVSWGKAGAKVYLAYVPRIEGDFLLIPLNSVKYLNSGIYSHLINELVSVWNKGSVYLPVYNDLKKFVSLHPDLKSDVSFQYSPSVHDEKGTVADLIYKTLTFKLGDRIYELNSIYHRYHDTGAIVPDTLVLYSGTLTADLNLHYLLNGTVEDNILLYNLGRMVFNNGQPTTE